MNACVFADCNSVMQQMAAEALNASRTKNLICAGGNSEAIAKTTKTIAIFLPFCGQLGTISTVVMSYLG